MTRTCNDDDDDDDKLLLRFNDFYMFMTGVTHYVKQMEHCKLGRTAHVSDLFLFMKQAL